MYRVIQVSSNDIIVMNQNNDVINCKLAGRFRIATKQNSNFIRVGDFVSIKEDDQDAFVIDRVHKRKNSFSRLKPHSKNQEQVIAANIDRILIIVAFADPMFKTGFIDRFLTVATFSKIEPILCFNKSDLTDIEFFEEELEYYKSLIGKVLITSSYENIGIDNLKDELKDKVTVVTGPSGVGKSTIINLIDDELEIRTSEVSDYSHKGQHTTTASHFYTIKSINGALIDTPGLREFGLFGIQKNDLKTYFSDFLTHSTQCKYYDCLHINEPGCYIKEAIETDELPYFRYESYLSMFNELDDREKQFYK